jgi:hypothetical protein
MPGATIQRPQLNCYYKRRRTNVVFKMASARRHTVNSFDTIKAAGGPLIVVQTKSWFYHARELTAFFNDLRELRSKRGVSVFERWK